MNSESHLEHSRRNFIKKHCGGLDGGKCLENGMNSRRLDDIWKIRQGSNVRKRISEREEGLRCCLHATTQTEMITKLRTSLIEFILQFLEFLPGLRWV